jgi:MFS superfamily sulfate permease-like transporter
MPDLLLTPPPGLADPSPPKPTRQPDDPDYAPVDYDTPWSADIRASVVVLLVAIPLCLGIALASGAPLASGLIAGAVGGIIVGALSGSQLMVSGPAAGLTAIVIVAINQLGSFPAFLTAVVLAGLLQLGLSALRAGIIGYYFPSAVIKGMLAAIGIILIMKQVPHALGNDSSYMGDEAFRQAGDATTFSAIGDALARIEPGAALIALLSLAVLVVWDTPRFKALKRVPAPLVVVALGVSLNALFGAALPGWRLDASHLVGLPIAETLSDWGNFFALPDLSAVTRPETWRVAVTLAVVASLETLLSSDATDKMDPYKREADTNRELMAQGVGNTVSGLIGGLPITGVIVRSAANIDAGARTKRSAILHGVLLVLCILTIPALLNLIPLSALAAILLYTGFKLAHPVLWRTAWGLGPAQFVPFAVTVVAIVLTDLLTGIAVGMAIGLFSILYQSLREPALKRVNAQGAVLQRFALPDHASFLMKANIERTLEEFPAGSRVEIDGRKCTRIDYDVLELLHDYKITSRLRNIDFRLVGVPDVPSTPAHKH